MTDTHRGARAEPLVARGLRALGTIVTAAPVFVLVLCLASAGASVWYTQQNLKLKTDRSDLIDPGREYHQRWLSYTAAFGNTPDMIVVVEGDTPAEIETAIDELGPRLESESDHFTSVLYRVDKSQLISKGLQYLSPDQLAMVRERLSEFGPLLNGRWDLLSVRGLFQRYRLALSRLEGVPENIAKPALDELLPQIAAFSTSFQRFIENKGDTSAYDSPFNHLLTVAPELLAANTRAVHYQLNEQGTMGFLNVRPVVPQNSTAGARVAIERLRAIMAELAPRHSRVRFGLTGIPVLESDEIAQSETDMKRASLLSFGLVLGLLVVGFAGFRLPILSILTLLVAMAWSFGFTTLVIGHLNILSISFAAMLIGLGIDFAIVFVAHYRDFRAKNLAPAVACAETMAHVGPGTLTASLTTAVAFLSAVFTDFTGVAELGIIACGGIVLCCLASFVVLPAALTLFDRGPYVPQRNINVFELGWLRAGIGRLCVPVCLLSGLGIVACVLPAAGVKYDYNLLNLQAQNLESVRVQEQIFKSSDASVLYAVSLANSRKDALALKARFEELPTVSRVVEMASWLPGHPAEKTTLIVQSIAARLEGLPESIPVAAANEDGSSSIDPQSVGSKAEELEEALGKQDSHAASESRMALEAALTALEKYSAEHQIELLGTYQHALANDLLLRLKALQQAASSTDPVSPRDFPDALSSRYFSPGNGNSKEQRWLLQVFPKSQVWDMEPLKQFVTELRQVDPEVTGTPVQTYEATREIVQSYKLIGLYALFAVMAFALVDMGLFVDPARAVVLGLMAMAPPLLGALVMFGILGLTNVSLNPANLIVLPLVIGIGVDGGVHIMHDFCRQKSGRYKPSASTFSAILLNGTTTVAGFGSMMIADHRGIRSLGYVLSVGVGACLLVACIFVPAALGWLTLRRQGNPATDSDSSIEEDSHSGDSDSDSGVVQGMNQLPRQFRLVGADTSLIPLRRSAAG